MTKSYAEICLERAEKAQIIAVEKHFSLETGCDAWLELQKLDSEIRDKIVPELARRLKKACDALRMIEVTQIKPYFGYKSLADELERVPEEK